MTKYGYAKIEHYELMRTVFHTITGFVKDIHFGYTNKLKLKVAILHINQLKAVIYCIRNCFELDVLYNIKAYPEALNE